MIEYFTSADFIMLMVKIVFIFGGVMGALAYLTWLERKVHGARTDAAGPHRVGPFGLLQPIADGLKFLFKEDVVPTNANRMLYIAAPVLALVPALLSFSVIPFGPSLQIADLSVGMLVSLRDHFPGRLWNRAGRVGIEFEISSDGCDAIVRANDQL